jgi:hypothetical protein
MTHKSGYETDFTALFSTRPPEKRKKDAFFSNIPAPKTDKKEFSGNN